MNDKVIGGVFGTALSAVGTALQSSQILETISLIITIVGGIITISMAVFNWWKTASKDGKIDKEEVQDLVNTIKDEVEDINKATSNETKDEEKK